MYTYQTTIATGKKLNGVGGGGGGTNGYPGNICNYQTGIEMIYGDLSPYSLITS